MTSLTLENRFSGRPVRAVLLSVLAVCLSISGGCESPDLAAPSQIFERDYYLSAQLGPSGGNGHLPDGASLAWTELGADRRLSIRQPVPSTLKFTKVPSGQGASFHFGGSKVIPLTRSDADGVEASVWCADSESQMVELYRVRSEEAANPLTRAWDDREIDLWPCSEASTRLELRAECHAASCENIEFVWGNPRVRYGAPVTVQPKRLVLLISIDTLRSDRMELYGGAASTPHLNRLAADGVVFEESVAPSPWTIPSHASLFTATYPVVHGTTAESDIPEALSTVAESIRGHGWTSAGFVDTPWLGRFGFDRGFDHYDATAPPRPVPRWGAGIVLQRLLDWLVETPADQVFLFWHIMDVHGPYGTSAPYAGTLRSQVRAEESVYPSISLFKTLGYHDYLDLGRFSCVEDIMAAYDEGVVRVDAAIGQLLEFLRETELYDSSLIVVTSDHGESLFDHDTWIGHGLFLYEDEIRIPLIVKLPGNAFADRRIDDLSRLIDVAPTLLDTMQISAPTTFQGRTLLPIIEGGGEGEPPMAHGTSTNTGAHYVRNGRFKYISPWSFPRNYVVRRHLHPKGDTPLLAPIDSGEQLFNLERDPTESENLIADPQLQGVASLLRESMSAAKNLGSGVIVNSPDSSKDLLSAEEIERLEALGYVVGNHSD